MTTSEKLLSRPQQARCVVINQPCPIGDASTEDKTFHTLRARLALAGHALRRSDSVDGPSTYYVTRWGLVRELRDLAAVEAFAEQVGGPIHG